MIEYCEEIKPFNYLNLCGDFSIVAELADCYFCAVGDVGGHGTTTVYEISLKIKKLILDNTDLELEQLIRLVHSQKYLKSYGMTLTLAKIFKDIPLLSYVGIGNIKGMGVKSNGTFENFVFQEGIVGYTLPSTIITNVVKIDKADTFILTTDGVSINQKQINQNLIQKPIKELAKELIEKYSKIDDDSLSLVIKYMGDKNLKTKPERTLQKRAIMPKMENKVFKRPVVDVKRLNNFSHKVLKMGSESLLISLVKSDKKTKEKLYKIFDFFKLDKKNNIKTSLFLLELQKQEAKNIQIFFSKNILQISVDIHNDYRDVVSCLFRNYTLDDSTLTLNIHTDNYTYNTVELDSFKELLRFGLDEEAMLLNKKLQEEVNKKLEELLEKESLNKKLTSKAYIDNLTGAYNRYKFEEVFNYSLNQYKRYDRNFCVAMIDIDHFKNFNDTFGHQIGDEVLIMLADESKRTLRASDTFARWGGEEFLILFSESSLEKSIIAANKLRKNISALLHPVAGSITASFGVSSIDCSDSLESILKRCDDALYRAKKSGRNCVEVEHIG